jgi:Ca-activated chloride channel family protein
MITGRYRKTGKAVMELSGREKKLNKTFGYNFDFAARQTENDFIAKLWAGRKINFLLTKIRFEGENDEQVQSVKNLAEEFGIVTPYTSYLVTEQEQELAASENRPGNQPMIKKMTDRKASLNARGMGSAAYKALGAMSKDAAKSSGYSAVMSSTLRQEAMEEAEQDEDMLIIHKNVAGKAFTLEDGVWKEHGINENQQKIKKIKFMNDEYLALSKKDKEIGKILSLGEEVLFSWKETIYKIEK